MSELLRTAFVVVLMALASKFSPSARRRASMRVN